MTSIFHHHKPKMLCRCFLQAILNNRLQMNSEMTQVYGLLFVLFVLSLLGIKTQKRHFRLVVKEPYFKFNRSGAYILQVAFGTGT